MIDRDEDGNVIDHDAHIFRAHTATVPTVATAPQIPTVPVDHIYYDDRAFIAQTAKPLPQSGMTRKHAALWRHAFAAVLDDARETRPPKPRTDCEFASVEHALSELASVRYEGYARRSPADPDRLRRNRSGARAPRPSRPIDGAHSQAERIVAVSAALAIAYTEPLDGGRVTVEDCRAALLDRLVGGRNQSEIAERLGLERKACGRMLRYGRARVQGYLEVRGVVPREETTKMKKLSDAYDLHGAAQIAYFLGVTTETLRLWRSGSAAVTTPPPVGWIGGRLFASTAELTAWVESSQANRRATCRSKPDGSA